MRVGMCCALAAVVAVGILMVTRFAAWSASIDQSGSRTSSRLTSAPTHRGPEALVKIVPEDLGYDLDTGDRSCDFDPARHEPTDRECVECSQRPPTDSFENRSCVCLCSAEQNHP